MMRAMRGAEMGAVLLLSACGGGAPAPRESTPPAAVRTDASDASPTPQERLADLAARYWEWRLETSPEMGTSLGDHRRDDRLSDLSESARRTNAARAGAMREELHGIDANVLSGQDRISWEVLDLQLTSAVEGFRLNFWLWDLDQMFGPHLAFPQMVKTEHPRRDRHDLENLIARYRAHSKQLDDETANLRKGLEAGYVTSQEATKRVIHQLGDEIAKRPEDRALFADPAKLPDAIPAAERAEIARTLNDVATREIVPALDRMRKMLALEYLPRTKVEVGIWTIPNGEEAYRFLIHEHTSTNLSPQEIHDIGRRELATLEAKMLEIARKMGHRGDLASFSKRVRADRRNYYRTRAELLDGFKAIHERAWAALPRAFGRLPQAHSEVRPIEAFQERDSPAAFYNGPSEDGARPGIFFANLFEPTARPKYNMEALTFHEAVPGHHLQISIAQEIHGLPDFRRHAGFTVFVEGWGLYSELVADELGLYTDDLSRYGMLNYQAWRANRLIVDTGMHSLHWSRQQAIDWLSAHSALTEREVVNEIDRYVIWPGQALAYMIGRLEIQRIRKKAEDALGDRFDVRAFHDVLLGSGAVPMTTAERIVDEWIASQAPAH
jgi:prolyl oligopeptidase